MMKSMRSWKWILPRGNCSVKWLDSFFSTTIH
jgi:hypothetical protein